MGFALFVLLQGWWCPGGVGFNLGTTGAKVFSGPATEEFGYTVQQFTNHQGKWLLVGSPRSGSPQNRKGDVYKCDVVAQGSTCERLNLQDSVIVPNVEGISTNMSLGSILTPLSDNTFMTCGPLWAQRCGSHYFCPGVCVQVGTHLGAAQSFAPSQLNCGPVDILVVLDGSDSIYPWPPVIAFLKTLLENLEIGPNKSQVSVMQYAVGTAFEFHFNSYRSKEAMLDAVSKMQQKRGDHTHTFSAIRFASEYAFRPQYGGRPGARKVMVVVSDGESNDKVLREEVIAMCEQQGITRFSIAVLGYYNRNNIDPKSLIEEMESIASTPSERHYFHVAEEEALLEIVGTLGERLFNIEGIGTNDDFQMEFAQVGFSAHQNSEKTVVMLGAVGAYGWSGTVVHHVEQKFVVLPEKAFERILINKTHSSYLGYSVTSLRQGSREFFVAGAPRANHTGLVVVYTVDNTGQASIRDTQRGTQIGSYFGSVLCPVDVNQDGTTDILLVGAPMFMSEDKMETGKVHLFSITSGILSDQGYLEGSPAVENARFGMAISAVPDLNQDGFNDIVVGAPLEDGGQGVVYVYFGDKTIIRLKHSQRIMGSRMDSELQYFGRSLDGSGDLNGDTIPDVSVGAYGKVVQLWSRKIAMVTVNITATPEKISVLNKTCLILGRLASCFTANICFAAKFRPISFRGPTSLKYSVTLDADLKSSRVSSRGLFRNFERSMEKEIYIGTQQHCEEHIVYMQQDLSDVMSLFALRVNVSLQQLESNPVLDAFRPTAWDFFIPFSKACGTDNVCLSDLELNVKWTRAQLSSSPMLVGQKNRRLSFTVTIANKKENAYNTRVSASYSKNLFFASITQPNNLTEVICTRKEESQTVICHLGFTVLQTHHMVTFEIIFDFNFAQPMNAAVVTFEAHSDSGEENLTDNKVLISVPVQYDAEVTLTREGDMSLMVDKSYRTKDIIRSHRDIGPEFHFMLKVSTGNLPISLLFLTIALPTRTARGNPLLTLTGVMGTPASFVSCVVSGLDNPIKSGKNLMSAPYIKESLQDITNLDCLTSDCQYLPCTLKNLSAKSFYSVAVTTRIWNSTLILASFEALSLSVMTVIETDEPNLLVIPDQRREVKLTIVKARGKGNVPFVVFVGSVLGGLLLLTMLTATLWLLGFFDRKQREQEERDESDSSGLSQRSD